MLQEKLYPHWAEPVRRWWNRKYNRIILFWVVTSVASFVVLFVIATDYIQWDKLNRDFLHSNEVSRAFLASFILVMDVLIVVQVWWNLQKFGIFKFFWKTERKKRKKWMLVVNFAWKIDQLIFTLQVFSATINIRKILTFNFRWSDMRRCNGE